MSFRPVSVPPSSLPGADRLRILALSDLHLPKPAPKLILDNREFLDRIDYVVLLGDMVAAYGTDREYDEVRTFIDKLKRPYTAVSGNHEWYFQEFDEKSGRYGQVWAEANDDEQRAHQEKFRRFYGVDSLWRSFESPVGHFVFLSIDDIENTKQESLSAAQTEFLQQETERAGQKPLFIFCHVPLMLENRLDMVYYEEERTGCFEAQGDVRRALEARLAPTFWMSGHVHLHPDHYLFPPYICGGNVWQVHCPDSWGYGRWQREHVLPSHYEGPFSRFLELDGKGVNIVTYDHRANAETQSFRIDY